MIELTDEQRRNLEIGKPVDVTDSQSSRPYVVLRKDVYDRIANLLFDDSEWSDADLLAQLANSFKDSGWDDPAMDAYDRYDEEIKKRCP